MDYDTAHGNLGCTTAKAITAGWGKCVCIYHTCLRMLRRMMVCDRYQPAHVIVSNIEWLSLIS